jgi:gliding motility-associated protein GldL
MAKGGFKEKFYEDIAPVITGLGAAVVIVGALFKIMHWPFASPMLIVGLGTEAVLFCLFAFAPKPAHDVGLERWSRVYPQLSEDFDGEYGVGEDDKATSDGLSKKLSEMMSDANIDQNTISSLGAGLKSLSSNVSNMKDLSEATVATQEFASNTKTASASMSQVSSAFKTTAEAMKGMANVATDAGEYHAQVQNITKNLGSLNAVYEMELQDANQHLKAMNKFYGNLSTAMDNMSEASKDTEAFKKNLSSLTSNLTQLNTIYGTMLSAMRGK